VAAGAIFLLRNCTRHDLSAVCHGEPAGGRADGRTGIADASRGTFKRLKLIQGD